MSGADKSGHARRLDSWKEVADYIGRDVRTAARWEKAGMPVHRISGSKGRAVFAYADEIDTWIAGDMRDIICPNSQKPCPILARYRGFDSIVVK